MGVRRARGLHQSKKRPPGSPDGLQRSALEIIEGTTLGLVTTATAGVFPVHLNQPAPARERLVVASAADRAVRRTKHPRAFVGIFCSAGVIPGVEVGV